MELLREIFLYSIEANQMKSGHLASVCRYWRSVITIMPHLWSTLKVGTWTETEQVTTWLQRAYPKKVVIDTQRDRESPSEAPAFAALQDAFASTGQWNELTISSLTPDIMASQLGIQGARPMNLLKALRVEAGCVHSPSFTYLLDLVTNEAPLSELRLYPSFASAQFLQLHWFPVLTNLTVLVVNGRNIDRPFELLPTFTRLQIFEADHLPLPFYELDIELPLLCTLHKLQLRASSIQWMAGRQFPCLEDCAILLPHHWGAVQQHEVQLPFCRKFTYHGYPMTTAQYFCVPQMGAMDLRSHDCREQRLYQQLHYLCVVDGRVSKLTTLHLTLQCSEQAFIKVLKYLHLLQELTLSIAHPSASWKGLLQALAAKPSGDDWPDWIPVPGGLQRWEQWQKWEYWYSSQTWHAHILPQLKYLGILCPKGFSQSECLDNCPILRLVGWTRAQLTPPLEHLNVWEGRGTTDDIVVDYISTAYLKKYPGISGIEFDSMIVRGMATQCLVIHRPFTRLFQFHSTVLFRQLQDLEVNCFENREIPILPSLEQIKRLVIWHGIVPEYSLDIGLPLIHTLQWLRLIYTPFSWVLGRTFKTLREFQVYEPRITFGDKSKYERLQVDLPACTKLELWDFSVNHLRCFSSPSLQIFRLHYSPLWSVIDGTALKALQHFLCTCPCLQNLDIRISRGSELHSLIQFCFCDAREQAVWRDIRSVEVKVMIAGTSNDKDHCFNEMVGHQQHYETWWKEFTVTMEDLRMMVIVRASM